MNARRNPLDGAGGRIFALALAVLASAGWLVWNLYRIQVVSGDEYASRLTSQSTTSVLLPPARGVIVDRRGTGLAENKASIDLDLYLNVLLSDYLRANKGKRPLTKVPNSKREMTDIARIVDETARDAIQSLGFDLSGVSRRDLLRHYDQKPNMPMRIARNLDFAALSRLAEHSVSVAGLEETARPVRNYTYGAFAAHILGNVGKVEDVSSDAAYVPEIIGKDGIEKSMDAWLQGVPGARVLRKNIAGHIVGVETVREPQSGGTVWLTLDARVQMIVEQEMRSVGRGACVVMSPAEGDILAMVSVPSFDPNSYAADLGRMVNDATHPLFNRAVGGYAPGSEFKPVTAMAAFRNRNINFTPNTVIASGDSWYHSGRQWNDWSSSNPGQGAVTVKTALQWSTNTFFYQLGVRTGIKSIQSAAAAVGMGERLLVDADGNRLVGGEAAGVIPGPEFLRQRNAARLAAWEERRKNNPQSREPKPLPEVWNDGSTINTSIGQGDVEVTPLQLAVMMCAIANGGTVWQPRLVWRVTDMPDAADDAVKVFPPRKRNALGLGAAQLRAIQEGLRAAVMSGTGKKAGIREFAVAGKTGTAQFWVVRDGARQNDYKTWFNSFAPFEQPRYVVTIMVEGGVSGGSTAAPIAARIYKRIAEMEKGAEVEMMSLPPAAGSFLAIPSEPADMDSADDTPSAELPAPARDTNRRPPRGR